MTVLTYICVLSVLLNLFMDTSLASIIKYVTREEICNTTIYLGSSEFAGILHFMYDGVDENDTFTCETIISTKGGSQISYTFQKPSKLSDIGLCNNRLQITEDFTTGMYCAALPIHEMITEGNQVTLTFTSRGKTSAYFSLYFNTFTMSPCHSGEVKCDNLRCISRTLACSQSYNWCGDNTQLCYDIVEPRSYTGPRSNTGTAIGISFTAIIIFVVLLGLFVKFRNNRAFIQRVKECLCRTPPIPSAPRTAADVFTIAGDDSDTEAGPIDYDQFAPPPEYSSLENIHQVNGGYTDSETDVDKDIDPPPPYQIVISNQEEYKVTLHI